MTINVRKLFNYWHRESEYSWRVSCNLLKSKDNVESLFFGHLALEKIMKAIIVVQTGEHAPRLHNLVKLAEQSGLSVTKEQVEQLRAYNDFYMAGRYDEQKMAFRKKATASYAKKYLKDIENTYLWLKKEAKKISQRA